MDRRRALEILALAEAAHAAQGSADASPAEALSARGDELPEAVNTLLGSDLEAALRLVATTAQLWQDAGRVDAGRALTDKAVAAGRAASARHDVAQAMPRALLAATTLAFRQGDQDRAGVLAEETIQAAMALGDRVTAALAHTDLARVAYRDQRAADIDRHARAALDMAGDDPMVRRSSLHMLAWAAHTAGDHAEARRRFESSLAFRRSLGNALSVAVELANLGDLALEDGDVGSAATYLAEGLALTRDNAYMLVNGLPSFAALAAASGIDADAARLFGAADRLIAESGLVPDPGARREAARAELEARLSPESMSRLVAQGRSLSTIAAIDLATGIAARLASGPA